MDRERRRTPRYMFFASAELLEEKSEVRVASRVSELSRYGCYLDMMNPFPKDTSVLLKIWRDEAHAIQTKGRIIYSQPNMGAGVVFVDLEEQYIPVLEQWLAQAAKES
jgi:PilZ domain